MRRASSNIIANPVMVGAATALVVVVGVFLAYNANKGLPFVPTFQFRVEVPDASRLVIGNDVREGGMRIGQVAKLEPVKVKGGRTAAELTLQLSKKSTPIPADSTILIRPRSALGSKFVEIIRGHSRKHLAQGAVLRPFLHALADVSPDVRSTAAELRRAAPPISAALASGSRTLPQTPPLSRDLRNSLVALRDLSTSPTTNLVLGGLGDTLGHLNPMLRYLGPHVTVCNYWNYWWTLLSDDLAENVASGTLQRVEAKSAPNQKNGMSSFGATAPANGQGADPASEALLGDPANLHAQPYGRAVDAQGNADCESGQRGYPDRLANGADPSLHV